MREFVWSAWFSTLWEFAVTNYTLPVLVTAILYLTIGQLVVFAPPVSKDKVATASRRFPQLWLFLMPGVFLLLTFKGLVWRHQYWQRPLSPAIAIAAAMGVMLLADILKKIHRRLSSVSVAILIGIFVIFCAIGTNYYYRIRWQPLAKINMLKMLNQRIPSDKALLSYEFRGRYFVNQHKSKGGHYRPEIAWYLDRDIEQATTLGEIEAKAATGRFSYYLVPHVRNDPKISPLINQLSQKYQSYFIRGEAGEADTKGRTVKAGMGDHWLFDLKSRVSSP